MSPVGHLQFGWWFAHWGKFNRAERAAIALAGAAPDLDGITFLAGSEIYYRTHHILLHNIGTLFVVLVLALIFYRRRMPVGLLVVFSFAMHMVEDYLTVGWNMHPWLPLSAAPVNLSAHLPNWMVQGVFQGVAMVFILCVTVWIYLRHQRTPLEIISPALDRVLVNYAILPWRHHCPECSRRATFRCDQCQRTFCSNHAKVKPRLVVRCQSCAVSS